MKKNNNENTVLDTIIGMIVIAVIVMLVLNHLPESDNTKEANNNAKESSSIKKKSTKKKSKKSTKTNNKKKSTKDKKDDNIDFPVTVEEAYDKFATMLCNELSPFDAVVTEGIFIKRKIKHNGRQKVVNTDSDIIKTKTYTFNFPLELEFPNIGHKKFSVPMTVYNTGDSAIMPNTWIWVDSEDEEMLEAFSEIAEAIYKDMGCLIADGEDSESVEAKYDAMFKDKVKESETFSYYYSSNADKKSSSEDKKEKSDIFNIINGAAADVSNVLAEFFD